MPHMTFDRSVPVWKQRLLVALKKSKRNHPKRHGTRKESAKFRAMKKAKIKARLAAKLSRYRKYKEGVKAYWRGDADEHPRTSMINPV